MKKTTALALQAALVAVAGLLVTTGAQAEDCFDVAERRSATEADVRTCTLEIQSGRHTGRNLAITYNNRGRVYHERKEYDIALADYNEAIRIHPQYAPAFDNRALVYRLKGDLDRAIADLNEAIRLDPKKSIAWDNRGLTYAQMGDLDRAITNYNEAIRLDPKDAYPFFNRGVAYVGKGEKDRAIADLRRAAELGHPNAADELRKLKVSR